jgi:hypothetical protein
VLTPRGPVETTARLWCCGTRCRTGRCRVGASASPLRALQAPPNADGPSMSVYVEKINGPMLFEHKATPAEYKAGLDLAIERGWLACTRAARSFASPRPARTCSPRNHIKRLGNPRGPAPAALEVGPRLGICSPGVGFLRPWRRSSGSQNHNDCQRGQDERRISCKCNPVCAPIHDGRFEAAEQRTA